jgi:E3 ubiquitin-protein ligase UHRF1
MLRPSTGSVDSHLYIQNVDKPDRAYTTERAKRAGKANASSGQIFMTTAPDYSDYFGPNLPEHDPRRKTGVRVGETWDDRLEFRRWDSHLPNIAGIAGQSRFGAQSVALSGGYEDDEDHGDWFLYTERFDNLTTNHSSTVFFCLVTDMFHYIKMCIK